MKQKRDVASVKPDYRWRRVKVAYVLISILIVLVTGFGVQASNNRQSCGQVNNFQGSEWWSSSSTKFDCSSPNELNQGRSLGILAVPVVILGAGYFLMPKLYRYLVPPKDRAASKRMSNRGE